MCFPLHCFSYSAFFSAILFYPRFSVFFAILPLSFPAFTAVFLSPAFSGCHCQIQVSPL